MNLNINQRSREASFWALLQGLDHLAMENQSDDDVDEEFALNFIRAEEDVPPCSGLFEKIMQFEEQSSSYMRQGKFFEAYGLLKNQHKLGPEIHFARVLVKYYVTLMQTDRADKADKVRNELITLLQEKFGDSADEICKYAKSLLEKDRNLEAFLFFQVAWSFVKTISNPVIVNQLSNCCVVGTKACAIRLYFGDSLAKKLVKDRVASWIRNVIDELGDIACVKDKKTSSLLKSACLVSLAECQGAFFDLEQAASLFNEAFNLIKTHHGKNAEKYILFAIILRKLGFTYVLLKRPREAIKVLPRAIAAFKKVEDDVSIAQKNAMIREAESDLRAAREMIKSQN